MSEEESTSPQPQSFAAEPTDHLRLRRVYQLASFIGDWPNIAVDPATWHNNWLPEPECERKDDAWRRLLAEGRYEYFTEAKKFYKAALVKARVPGPWTDDVFYLALRHFPPGG